MHFFLGQRLNYVSGPFEGPDLQGAPGNRNENARRDGGEGDRERNYIVGDPDVKRSGGRSFKREKDDSTDGGRG